ncbi:MAG: phage/plasmid primase, P4 family [Candidatus Bathyarchaeia archaeon]|jgi:P4 family phage/plasmid primase-like protien
MTELTALKTSPEEFSKFLSLIPQIPIFIPIISSGKRPDIPAGESWKTPQYHLTPEQALNRLKEGKNVGVVANDWLVIIDLDNPDKFKLDIKTLTVETRNGKLHMYFQNAGDVENAVGKNSLAKCGEARAEWQYVLAPGSYVPCDDDKNESGNGLYHIIDPSPLAILHKKDLPEDFIPSTETIEVNPEVLNTEFSCRNKHGWTIDDIRNRDKKLNELLNNKNANLPSPSEADMATLAKLLFWEFTEGEAVAIIKKYRYRPKLERADYITNMLGHLSRKDKISDKINPQKWNPTTGYMIDLTFGNKESNPLTQHERIDIDTIIEAFKKEFIFKTPTDTEELHYFFEGIYKPAEHIIKTMLENTLGAKATIHNVNEIIEHLKWHSYIDRSEFNKFTGTIPVLNGLLDLDTGILTDFTPEQIFTFKLQVKYDKTADCQKFKQWLTEVQTKDNIVTLQEYAGYNLLPSMPFHKSIWFIGEGRNGKSTFITTMEKILGENNVEHIPIQALNGERNFAESQLYGKLINISSEPTTKNELETPLFKKLTGNDFISAEVKCKQKRIGFRSIAKFYILGNKYPRVRDNTTAFKERIIVIKWEAEFIEGKNQIQNIEKTWLDDPEERSGILNWMIKGLQRLLDNRKFTLTKTQHEMMIEFERASDSIAAWTDERLIFNPNKYIEREKIAQDYMDYCAFYGIFQADKKKLFDRLRNTPKIKDTKTRILGKQERVWKGIDLKPPLEIPEEDDIQQSQLQTGTLGTVGTAENNTDNLKENINKIIKAQTPVPDAPTVPLLKQNEYSPTERICGNCGRFHTSACYYPGGNFENLNSDSGWAYECKGFIVKQPDLPNYPEGES